MLFTRRNIQAKINLLRKYLDEHDVAKLVSRLNNKSPDSLAAVWEVTIISSLLTLGEIIYEEKLSDGRQPDVQLKISDKIIFTADITCVSDEGLNDANPVKLFWDLLEKVKRKFELGVGGINGKVEEKVVQTSKGKKRVLRLPKKNSLEYYIKNKIEPEIIRQKELGIKTISYTQNDDEAGLSFTFGEGPYSSMGYGSFENSTISISNPVYNALYAKKGQVRNGKGARGIFLCDGGCKSLSMNRVNWNEVTIEKIIDDFLNNTSSVDFVVIYSFKENRNHDGIKSGEKISLVKHIFWNNKYENLENINQIEVIIEKSSENFSTPKVTPTNAYYQVRNDYRNWGLHGAYSMSNNKLKVSSRAILEVLSGKLSVEEFNKIHGWKSLCDSDNPDKMINPFENMIKLGRILDQVSIIKCQEEHDDDWVEFSFSKADAAINKFE